MKILKWNRKGIELSERERFSDYQCVEVPRRAAFVFSQHFVTDVVSEFAQDFGFRRETMQGLGVAALDVA